MIGRFIRALERLVLVMESDHALHVSESDQNRIAIDLQRGLLERLQDAEKDRLAFREEQRRHMEMCEHRYLELKLKTDKPS